MTFEELLKAIAEDYVNPEKGPDGNVHADRNGHMRLAELQRKYNLSSLKVQKLLVSAGVYEPVKSDSAYYAVKALRQEGKSAEEIMEELCLSKAAVNAFLPYERGADDLDKLGVELSDDAVRKRRQRSNEEMKKENARNVLADTMSDKALWDALSEHSSETFVTDQGQRFVLNVVCGRSEDPAVLCSDDLGVGSGHSDDLSDIGTGNETVQGPVAHKAGAARGADLSGMSTGNEMALKDPIAVPEEEGRNSENEITGSPDRLGASELAISKQDNEMVYIPRAEVMEAYHRAIEERAGEGETERGAWDEFLRPVFIYLGILEGDRNMVTTKRSVPEENRCYCCGRKFEPLYTVASFDELMRLNDQFEEEWQRKYTKDEEGNVGSLGLLSDEKKEWEERNRIKRERARKSAAAQAFDQEGGRKFCRLCCETIADALLNGEVPSEKRTGGYDELKDDALRALILEECQTAKSDYFQVYRGVLKASAFDNRTMFLYEVLDRHGQKHSFALRMVRSPSSEENAGFGFEAREVHRLTKSGKLAAGSTSTDYETENFRRCWEGEEEEHTRLVCLAELMEKVKEMVRVETLCRTDSVVHNCIPIGGVYYGLEEIGTIIPVYAGDADQYRSMRGREWNGDDYGFLIDGKLFSGEELALMFSCYEGSQIKFYADDPNAVPLRTGEFLMQVRLSQNDLVEETIGLINVFAENGRFEREKDQTNFCRMFEKYLLEKFRLYHESQPRGYGRLAGMEIIRKLKLIEGTESCQEMIRGILGKS